MRTSHILIRLFEAWSTPNENFSSSHHVYQIWQLPKRELLIISSSQIFNGEIMRTSHILIKFIETSLLPPPPLPQLLLGGGEMMRFSHLHKLTKISWEDENISKVDENSRLKKASAGTSCFLPKGTPPPKKKVYFLDFVLKGGRGASSNHI